MLKLACDSESSFGQDFVVYVFSWDAEFGWYYTNDIYLKIFRRGRAGISKLPRVDLDAARLAAVAPGRSLRQVCHQDDRGDHHDHDERDDHDDRGDWDIDDHGGGSGSV